MTDRGPKQKKLVGRVCFILLPVYFCIFLTNIIHTSFAITIAIVKASLLVPMESLDFDFRGLHLDGCEDKILLPT